MLKCTEGEILRGFYSHDLRLDSRSAWHVPGEGLVVLARGNATALASSVIRSEYLVEH